MRIRSVLAGGACLATLVLPALHAVADPGTGSGTCVPAPSSDPNHPVPSHDPSDSSTTLPDGSTVYYQTPSGPAGELVVQGAHGYLEAKGSATAMSGSVDGYSTDMGNANGQLGGTNQGPQGAPFVCLGANGTVVHD